MDASLQEDCHLGAGHEAFRAVHKRRGSAPTGDACCIKPLDETPRPVAGADVGERGNNSQFTEVDIVVARGAQIVGARSGVEIGHAKVIADAIDIPNPIDSDAHSVLNAGTWHLLDPDEVAVR